MDYKEQDRLDTYSFKAPWFNTRYGWKGSKDKPYQWAEGDIVWMPESKQYGRVYNSCGAYCKIVFFDPIQKKTDWKRGSDRLHRYNGWELHMAANSVDDPEPELIGTSGFPR